MRSVSLVILIGISTALGCVRPLTQEQYRQCREALYGRHEFFFRNAMESWMLNNKLKSQVSHISDSLGYSYSAFSAAHERYGVLKLPYSTETQLLFRRGRERGKWKEFFEHHYLAEVTSDLCINPARYIEIAPGPEVRFDGFRTTLGELPALIEHYDSLKLHGDSTAKDIEVPPLVEDQGFVQFPRGFIYFIPEDDASFNQLWQVLEFLETDARKDTSMQSEVLGAACMLPGINVMFLLAPADALREKLASNKIACFLITSEGRFVTTFGDTLSPSQLSSLREEQQKESPRIKGIALTGDGIKIQRLGEILDSLGLDVRYFYLFPREEFESFRNKGCDVLRLPPQDELEPEDVESTESLESQTELVEVPVVPFEKLERTPKVIYSPRPEYPASARNADKEGTVIIEATVDTDGLVVETKVSKSSGYEELDEAALSAARKWTFTPAEQRGKPVMTQVSIPFTFRLGN